MKKFRGGVEKFCRAIQYISMVAVMFAVIITVIDIILHWTTNIRVLGNMEMVELAMVIMMFLCFGITHLENGHVRVDMLVNRFGPKVRCATNGIVQCVCAVFCIMMAVQAFLMIGRNIGTGKASSVLHIPYFPFYIIMFVGLCIYALTIIVTAIEYFVELPNAQPITQPQEEEGLEEEAQAELGSE